MKKNMKSVMLGIVLGGMIFGSAGVFAKGISRNIDVVFGKLDIFVNGEKTKNETISYDGTTYVAIREVAEKLGATVNYDGETLAVYIEGKDYGNNNVNIIEEDINYNYEYFEEIEELVRESRREIEKDIKEEAREKYGFNTNKYKEEVSLQIKAYEEILEIIKTSGNKDKERLNYLLDVMRDDNYAQVLEGYKYGWNEETHVSGATKKYDNKYFEEIEELVRESRREIEGDIKEEARERYGFNTKKYKEEVRMQIKAYEEILEIIKIVSYEDKEKLEYLLNIMEDENYVGVITRYKNK